MKIEILSPNQTLFKEEGEAITLPGKEGQFQVLKDHAPLFALLDKGEIIIDEKKKIPILSGLVEVLENQVIVLIKK